MRELLPTAPRLRAGARRVRGAPRSALRRGLLAALLLAALAGLPVAGQADSAPTATDTAPTATDTAPAATDTAPATGGAAAAQPAAQPTTPTAPAPAGVELSAQAYAIANELRCPVCTAESVADSNAEIAGEMRRLIQQQLDQGKSREQILAYFRQRYGDWIMLDPPKTGIHLLVWLLPILAALAGAATLAVLLRRWRRAAEQLPAADAADLERVRNALGAQDDEAAR